MGASGESGPHAQVTRQVPWSVATTAIHISRCSGESSPNRSSSLATATVRTSSQSAPPPADSAAIRDATVLRSAVTGRATCGGVLRRRPTSRATTQISCGSSSLTNTTSSRSPGHGSVYQRSSSPRTTMWLSVGPCGPIASTQSSSNGWVIAAARSATSGWMPPSDDQAGRRQLLDGVPVLATCLAVRDQAQHLELVLTHAEASPHTVHARHGTPS